MKVTALHRYPIKSTRAHSVDALALDRWGARDDRRMMLVDADGRFVTARKHPDLARCETTRTDAGWRVTHPEVVAPLRFDDALGELVEVEVWGDRFDARALAPAAGRWFSELLDVELRLVAQSPESRRPLDPEFTPDPSRDETVFADGFPLLITSLASLEALNRELDAPVGMDRFRPNIVVDAELAWEEDAWLELEIGQLRFACVKPCVRCSLTGVDPDTAQRAPEPLRTLGRLRPDVSFGVNLVHASEGEIAVGDPVHVSRRRPG